MTAPIRPSPRFASDDPLDELPPIDGDDDDQVEAPVADDLAAEVLDEEQDPDDSVADDLHVGELVEPVADDAPAVDEASELDIGEPVVAFGEASTGKDDDDVGGAAGDDLTLGIDAIPEQGEGDSAGESVMGGGEAEVDEALFPELDSDDDADLPGELHVDDTVVPDDIPLPEWAAVRWERLTIPLVAVPMACLWIGEDRVIAAGEAAVELGFDSDTAPAARWLALEGLPAAEVVAVQGDEGDRSRLLVATRHGVHVSVDGGASAGASTFRAQGEATVAGVFAYGPGWRACYAEVSDGSLFASARGCGTWTQLEGLGDVRAVARDGGGSVFVVALRETPALLTFDAGGRWESEALPGEVSTELRAVRAWLAVGAGTVALGTPGGSVWRRGSGTEAWGRLAVAPEACSAAVVDAGSGAFVVVAVYIESEDRSYLLRIGAEGVAELVADLSPDVTVPAAEDTDGDVMGRVSAVAWDSRRGWLWVAGRFGLQAWRPVFPA